MNKKKSLQELTIKDNFMFGAVMLDPENCKGKNADEVPLELVKLLDYVGASLLDSEQEFEDEFVRKLQSAVRDVKASREMGARYMTFQELLNDERAQERIQIAERMLKDGVAIEDVINYTQLTEEQLRELMGESKQH